MKAADAEERVRAIAVADTSFIFVLCCTIAVDMCLRVTFCSFGGL